MIAVVPWPLVCHAYTGALLHVPAVVRGLEGPAIMQGRGHLPPPLPVRHHQGASPAEPIPRARVVSERARVERACGE